MQTYRIETIVAPDRVLTLQGVPFRAGEHVEVIVISLHRELPNGTRYPLRGKPFRYDAPFEPIALNDWDALQ